MKLFLDLDGVIVDLVSGFLKQIGADSYVIPNNTYKMYEWDYLKNGKIFNISKQQTDDLFDSPSDFWVDLPKYPWSDDLVDFCKTLAGVENLFILSAPSKGESCKGKVEWIEKHYPELSKQIILTKHKYLCASSDHILIDDSDWKIEDFISYGGNGVIFPQQWNSNHSLSHKKINYTYNKLEELANGFC